MPISDCVAWTWNEEQSSAFACWLKGRIPHQDDIFVNRASKCASGVIASRVEERELNASGMNACLFVTLFGLRL